MAQSLEKLLNQKLAGIFAKHGLDTKFAVVKVSDRPDLSDFQCNGALALAKPLRRNPREIAALIAGELEQDADIAKISEIAKKHNCLLIVDNTFLSPYFQNPLDLGADIVIHSGTKVLGGHNDTLAGFIVTNREEIRDRLRFLIKTTGAGLAPFDSWLILRGIKTLGIRMKRSSENAEKIALWLQKQSIVKEVFYPGLPTHPGYEILKKQARG